MPPQPPEKKQLRKQDFSSNCYFTQGGAVSERHLISQHRISDMPTANRRVQTGFWEAKDDAVGCNVRRITQEAHNGRGVIGSLMLPFLFVAA